MIDFGLSFTLRFTLISRVQQTMATMEKKVATSGTNVSSDPSINEGLTADAAAAAGTAATDAYVFLDRITE